MKRIALLMMTVILLCTASCGRNSKEKLSYSDAYDELVMRFTSLDSLSAITHVGKNDLIKIRYGQIAENPELTETLGKILKAYQDRNPDDLKSIKNKTTDYTWQNASGKISMENFRKANIVRARQYPEIKDFIISDFIDDRIDDFIEKKYSLFTVIPNTWNYYTKSDQEFADAFLKDFNASDIGSRCDEYYISRVNDYKSAVCDEYNIVAGESPNIPDFKVLPADVNDEMNGTIKDLIISRTKSQIAEISSDIFWDIIVALVVSIVFSLIIDNAIDNAREQAVNDFIERLTWKKGDGFLTNAGRAIWNGLSGYADYSEKKESIRRKYNFWKVIVNICIFVLSFIIAWLFFIQPQLKMESELNRELSTKLIKSSNTLGINPERMINQFVNIDESEYIAEEEAVVVEEAVADTVVEATEPKTSEMGDYPIVVEGETVLTFSGNIGPYPVVMECVEYNETDEGEANVEGRYKYIKTGGILKFDGKQNRDGSIVLNEYTPKGNNSGTFRLRRHGNLLEGSFVNLSNGKEFEVSLRLE